jgi:catabolite regulation protein CreA
VTALDDADVPGVTLYISDFKRSIADKLSKVITFILPL